LSFYNLLTSSKQLSLEDVGEGNLEVKLPTIWTDEKAEVGRVREEKRREEERRSEKVEKSRNTVFFWRVEK